MKIEFLRWICIISPRQCLSADIYDKLGQREDEASDC